MTIEDLEWAEIELADIFKTALDKQPKYTQPKGGVDMGMNHGAIAALSKRISELEQKVESLAVAHQHHTHGRYNNP